MNRIKVSIIAIFLSLLMVSCGGGNQSKAVESSALEFVTAILNFDFEDAAEVSNEETKEGLMMLQQMMTLASEDVRDEAEAMAGEAVLEVQKSTISQDGKSATVTILVKKSEYDRDSFSINMEKIDDKWLVANYNE